MIARGARQAATLEDEIQRFNRDGEIIAGATYSRAFAAHYFGVSLATVDRWIALGSRGGLYPTIKLSHKVRRVKGSAILRRERAAIC